jgi:hypothetical protein
VNGRHIIDDKASTSQSVVDHAGPELLSLHVDLLRLLAEVKYVRARAGLFGVVPHNICELQSYR